MSKRDDQVVAILRDMGAGGVMAASAVEVAIRYATDAKLQVIIADPAISQNVVPFLLDRVIQLVEADRIAAFADRSAWKEGWWAQRDATGLAYWDGYEAARQDVLDGHPDRYVSGPRPRSRD